MAVFRLILSSYCLGGPFVNSEDSWEYKFYPTYTTNWYYSGTTVNNSCLNTFFIDVILVTNVNVRL